MRIWMSMATVVMALTSCAADKSAKESPPPERKSAAAADTNTNCPPVGTLKESAGWELGAGSYHARREGEQIFVTATGQHPTAGYAVQLVRHPMKRFPPVFMLYHTTPEGNVAQVITPFSVCASFRAGQPVEAITVRDSQGEHRVAVENGR
jgi:hypothetical protein